MPSPAPVVAPTHDDPFVAGTSRLAGGPLGRHAGRAGRWWTPLRVLLVLTVLTCAFGWAQKAPCRTHPWAEEYQYTRMCYSDVYALYFAEGLRDGQLPYRDHEVEYPVAIGALMEVGALAAKAFPAGDRPQRFFDITALLLAACALVVTWTTARLAGRRRVWDAAMVALAPVLLLHAYTNWDLAAAALAGAGLLAWSRSRLVWAGIALGLGVATKLYPLLLLLALLLLALRARRLRAWGTTAAAAAATWLVVDLPVWAAYPSAFGRFYALNRTRPADWDSVWFAVEHWRGRPLDSGLVAGSAPTVLNLAVAITFVLVVAAVGWLVLTTPQRPRVAQVAFLVVTGFLLTNKVWSPQYALWLLPLVVLARPRWPMFLLWQATEAFLLFTRFYFFVGNDKTGEGLPVQVFLGAVLLRDAVLVAIAVLVVREIRRPTADVVRRDGVDDPAGGPLVGAEAPPLPAAVAPA